MAERAGLRLAGGGCRISRVAEQECREKAVSGQHE